MTTEPATAIKVSASLPAFPRTTRRVLTRRGVLWLGQTCNQRCYFCYFLDRIADANHPEHPFMGLDKAKTICKTLREFYGNNAIDIQGGEPTIYPDILALCRHCRDIGLLPTLITNGLRLGKPGVLEAYKDNGIRDFLVSLHGLHDVHDRVVGVSGAHDDIMAAIERMREVGIPFRFNCTMSKPVVAQLQEVAQKAIEFGAYVVNYIAFNPYEDQGGDSRAGEDVARYSEIKPRLAESIDMLEQAGIEVNVRYLPLCMAEERHRKNFYNFQQLPYDIHEWDYQSWMWTGLQPERMRDGGLVPPFRLGFKSREIMMYKHPGVRRWVEEHPLLGATGMLAQRCGARVVQAVKGMNTLYRGEAIVRAAHDAGHKQYDACTVCALRGICDGLHGDYANMFGTDEITAVQDMPLVEDHLTFVKTQDKYVEPEDEHWAM